MARPRKERRWRAPKPLYLLILLAQLNSSPFLAKAQYIKPTSSPQDGDGPSGWGSRDIHSVVSGLQVGKRDDQSSDSRQLFLHSYDDFCLFGPPDPFNYIWSSGLNVVSWCSKAGHGTRLIPDGTVQGVTYVATSNWVQVSGYGDFTKINIAPGDQGGQFDSSKNTPDGASVQTNDGNVANWVTLISAEAFCVRACHGDAKYCPAEYDQMGCWFLTGNSVGPSGTYQNCGSDVGDPPGVIDGSTYSQGASPTPSPTAPALRDCQPGSSISNGQAPPPMQSWSGDASGATLSGTATSGGNSAGSTGGAGDGVDAGGGDGGDQGSATNWVPVSTCIPCTGGASGSSATSTSAAGSGGGSDSAAGGKTEQVGVTQASKIAGALQVASSSGSGSAAAAATATATAAGSGSSAADTTTSAAAAKNDLLDKRSDDGGETITSDGQCCFTTWTPSIAGATNTDPANVTQTGSAGVDSATLASGGITAAGSATGAAGAAGAKTTGTGAAGAADAGSLGSLGLGGTSVESLSGAGAVTGAGGKTAAGLSASATGTSTGAGSSGSKAAGSLVGGSNSTNSTNSTGNGSKSGAPLRIEGLNIDGLGRVIVALSVGLGLATLLGGWTVV